MPYSCDRFQTQGRDELATTLTELITALRRVLIHPELGPAAKLSALATVIDVMIAPPPEPAGTGGGTPLTVVAGTPVTHPPVPAWSAA